jgi:hypothetical protein
MRAGLTALALTIITGFAGAAVAGELISLRTYSCASLLDDFQQNKLQKAGTAIFMALGADLATSQVQTMTIDFDIAVKVNEEVPKYCQLIFNRNKTLVTAVGEVARALGN